MSGGGYSSGAYGGYVLAGGRSSRMGRDKALLVLDGETLLERTARAVWQAAGSAVIVGDPAQHSFAGFPVIADMIPGAGPLSGIHAALTYSLTHPLTHAARHDPEIAWNLIVACDMPGLAAPALAEILEHTRMHPEADVLLPESGDYPQPLCAVYRTRILPHLESALRAGQFKLTAAIARLAVVRIPIADSRLFRNVNTPAEWGAETIAPART